MKEALSVRMTSYADSLNILNKEYGVLHDMLQEVEELESDVENERQRGDEQFDRAEQLQEELSTFEHNEHEEYEVVDKDEFVEYQKKFDKIEELQELLADLKDAAFKRELGVATAEENYNEALEALKDFDL